MYMYSVHVCVHVEAIPMLNLQLPVVSISDNVYSTVLKSWFFFLQGVVRFAMRDAPLWQVKIASVSVYTCNFRTVFTDTLYFFLYRLVRLALIIVSYLWPV